MKTLVVNLQEDVAMIRARKKGHRCPVCKNALEYQTTFKDGWMDANPVDGIPETHPLQYLNAAYEVCFNCGFATRNLDMDDLHDIDKYRNGAIGAQMVDAIKNAKSPIESMLLSGVVRYFDDPKAWHLLVLYYRVLLRIDSLIDIMPTASYMYKDTLCKSLDEDIRNKTLPRERFADAATYIFDLFSLGDAVYAKELCSYMRPLLWATRQVERPVRDMLRNVFSMCEDVNYDPYSHIIAMYMEDVQQMRDMLKEDDLNEEDYKNICLLIVDLCILRRYDTADELFGRLQANFRTAIDNQQIGAKNKTILHAMERAETFLNKNADQSDFIPLFLCGRSELDTPREAFLDHAVAIQLRRKKAVCPVCKKPIKSHNEVDLSWVANISICGLPTEKDTQMKFLKSLYQYCPDCGFVTKNDKFEDPELDVDYLLDEPADSLLQIAKSTADEFEKALIFGVARYNTIDTWAFLFQYLLNVNRLDRAKAFRQLYLSEMELVDYEIRSHDVDATGMFPAVQHLKNLCAIGEKKHAKKLVEPLYELLDNGIVMDDELKNMLIDALGGT